MLLQYCKLPPQTVQRAPKAVNIMRTSLQLSISDIAPNYTGSLIAIINTVGNAMGFLTPIVTSAIVDANVSILPFLPNYDYATREAFVI